MIAVVVVVVVFSVEKRSRGGKATNGGGKPVQRRAAPTAIAAKAKAKSSEPIIEMEEFDDDEANELANESLSDMAELEGPCKRVRLRCVSSLCRVAIRDSRARSQAPTAA